MENLSVYRLSPQQKRIIKQEQRLLEAAQLGISITGSVDINILKETIKRIIHQDAVFKTTYSFAESVESPIQIIDDTIDFIFIEKKEEDPYKDWEHHMADARVQRFDLGNGPLMRVDLVAGAGEAHLLIITVPGICSDFYSLGVLATHLKNMYTALITDNVGTDEKNISYLQFSEWQNQLFETEEKQDGIAYWNAKKFPDQPVCLPFDKDPNYSESFSSQTLCFDLPMRIDPALNSGVVTLESFLGLCWQLVLWHFTGKQALVTGHINTGRDFEDLNKTLGLFSRCLPVSVKLTDKRSFKETLLSYQQVLETNDEFKLFYEAEISSINKLNDFPFVFEFSDISMIFSQEEKRNAIEFDLLKREMAAEASKIHLRCIKMQNGMKIEFQFNKNAFDTASIELIADVYKTVVEQCASDPTLLLEEIELMNVKDIEILHDKFNNSNLVSSGSAKTADMLFKEQVLKYPDAIALIAGDQRLSYKKLDERATSLAIYLNQEMNIRPGDRIALLCEENEHMIIGMLGIIKAGGAYVPIDPANPSDRIQFILKDSLAKLLLTETLVHQKHTAYKGDVLCLDQLTHLKISPNSKNCKRQPESPVYIIYTSGTTGTPKGVIIPDRALINYTYWLKNTFSITSEDSSVLLSSFAFDLGYTSIWGTLLNGGCLHLVANSLIKEPEQVVDYLISSRISFIKTTPSLFHVIAYASNANKLSSSNLRLVIMGGEPIRVNDLKYFANIKPDIELVNHYGPTESTIGTIATPINKTSLNTYRIHPVIGKPIANSYISILDHDNKPVVPGIAGELCVSGHGLALGYFHREELTLEKFVPHPFKAGMQMYRTGDQACWMPDGNILFIGRKDDQVKIRGYRVELNEVQHTLLQFNGIRQAVVIAIDNNTFGKELVAYFESETPIELESLRSFLMISLPDAFIPSYFIRLDSIPLTANGKIDKRGLPDPRTAIKTTNTFAEPRTAYEVKMAGIWKEILRVDQIGILDNFFDLGGHSLKAIQLSSEIHKHFNIKIDIRKIFTNPTIEALGKILQISEENNFAEIQPLKEQVNYELSHTQKRMWIISQLEGGAVAYNVPSIFIMKGNLKMKAIKYAFNALIERHENFRTVFKEDEHGEIKQFIHLTEDSKVEISCSDLRNEEEMDKKLKILVNEEFIKPFDLANGPLLRVSLFQIANNKWVFTYVMHHIISDAWSRRILIEELLVFYNAYIKKEEHSLQPLRIQYKDYVVWQKEQLSSVNLKQYRAYWLKQFEGILPVLELRGDRVRPAIQTFNGAKINKTLSSATSKGIKFISGEQNCTLFMGLLAGVNALLHRYTNQTDIIIGTPVIGRAHADLKNQIGLYVNTLALRTRFSGENSFNELLTNVRHITLGAYEHQLFPFDELIQTLGLQRDMSRNPLFDVSITFRNEENNEIEIGNLPEIEVDNYDYKGENMPCKMDLLFTFEAGEEVEMGIEYNRDIYNEITIRRLMEHFVHLLEDSIRYPDKPLNQLEFLSEKEKNQLIVELNKTAVDYPGETTIVDLFEEQASLLADKTALVFGGTELSYKELNEKSNQLANYLRLNNQINADDLIGVMLDRSEKAIIAILGILKSGAAYVPIDSSYPKARKEFIVKDSGIKMLITQTDYIFDLEYYTGSIFAIDAQLDGIDTSIESPGCKINPEDLAYVIYTSGSTGEPKGVMIDHGAIANTIYSQRTIFNIKERERGLQFASLSFDASVWEIFYVLSSGGILYIISETDKKDPLLLANYITENKIEFATIPPAYLQLIQIEKIQNLKKLVTAGEAAIKSKVVEFSSYGDYYNAYGPTETSICASVFKVDKGSEMDGNIVPIGVPISNTQIYIVDERQSLVPIGSVGEICIGGTGLARGYLNKPELTAKKFVSNPFKEGKRIYKTGDLGRWLPDGNIEFIGRMDNQVKMNGYRIELGEIENIVLQQSGIKDVVALVKEDNKGNKDLVVYYVPAPELIYTSKKIAVHIKETLLTQLPGYMVPNHFIQLDELPLTTNGKIDKNKLPDPEDFDINTGIPYIAPRNELEHNLVAVLEEVLKKQPIGIKDNFFELGGDSMRSIQVAARLKQKNYSLVIQDIILHPVVEDMAQRISITNHTNEQETITENVLPGKLMSDLKGTIMDIPKGIGHISDLSYNQLYYFFECNIRIDNVTIHYENPDIDMEAFKLALNQLIERHEGLRTIFVPIDGAIKQKILPMEELTFESIDVIPVASEYEMNAFIEKDLNIKFDLSTFPLFLVRVCKVEKGNYHILVTIHHIIIDGYSSGILKNELLRLYSGILKKTPTELKRLTFQYRDFSNWQRKFIDSEDGAKHKKYWLEKLEGFSPLVKFPPSALAINNNNGAIRITKIIEGNLYEEMNLFAKKNNLSRSVLVMGALNLLLNKLSGQDDIALFFTISARHSEYYGELDASEIIGFCANRIIVRNIINEEVSLLNYLQRVQDSLFDDLSYGDYPFNKLIFELPDIFVEGDFLDSLFYYNYHNYDYLKESIYEIKEIEKEGKLENINPETRAAYGLFVHEYKNYLKLEFIVNPDAHQVDPEEIKDCYWSILQQMFHKPQLLIKQLKEQLEDKNIQTSQSSVDHLTPNR